MLLTPSQLEQRLAAIAPKVIVIGGSAGSFHLVLQLLASLPSDTPFSLLICLHRLRNKREGFQDALSTRSKLKIVEPDDKTPIQPGVAYIAPANYHMLVETEEQIALSTTPLERYSRPAIDPLFESAADVFGPNLVGILLSGANSDGTQGLRWVKYKGGITIVQDPNEAQVRTMPEFALRAGYADAVLSVNQIIQLLQHYRVRSL